MYKNNISDSNNFDDYKIVIIINVPIKYLKSVVACSVILKTLPLLHFSFFLTINYILVE